MKRVIIVIFNVLISVGLNEIISYSLNQNHDRYFDKDR